MVSYLSYLCRCSSFSVGVVSRLFPLDLLRRKVGYVAEALKGSPNILSAKRTAAVPETRPLVDLGSEDSASVLHAFEVPLCSAKHNDFGKTIHIQPGGPSDCWASNGARPAPRQ